jgi:hypothetical protein
MKRVLLLVCLIVSLVQLDWERDRVYLLSTIASLLLIVSSELMRRQKVQKAIAAGTLTSDEGVASVAYSQRPCHRTDHCEGVERPTIATGEVAFMRDNSG